MKSHEQNDEDKKYIKSQNEVEKKVKDIWVLLATKICHLNKVAIKCF